MNGSSSEAHFAENVNCLLQSSCSCKENGKIAPGQLEISRRLPKKLIAVKQKDGRDESKTPKLLLKGPDLRLFQNYKFEPCVLKDTFEVYQTKH